MRQPRLAAAPPGATALKAMPIRAPCAQGEHRAHQRASRLFQPGSRFLQALMHEQGPGLGTSHPAPQHSLLACLIQRTVQGPPYPGSAGYQYAPAVDQWVASATLQGKPKPQIIQMPFCMLPHGGWCQGQRSFTVKNRQGSSQSPLGGDLIPFGQ